MTAIELLFAVVLVGAVPLALRAVELGDAVADGWIRRVQPAVWPASTALAIALFLAPGPLAAALALPWLVATSLLALFALVALARAADRLRPTRRLAVAVTLGFLAFGAVNAISFAVGFGPLGFAPAIVLLTAVHFHAAGFVLMTAGILAADRAPARSAAAGVGAIGLGSIVTAAGFVGVPGAAVVGAVIVASGGLLIGWATLRVVPTLGSVWARRSAALGAAALFLSMPLAIGWAVGTWLGVPPLGLDVMVRTHGAINALAVCVPLMLGWTLDTRARGRDRRPSPVVLASAPR
jgi:hypothetical protein